jgi:MFS family permease
MNIATEGVLPRPTPMQRWLVLLFVSLAMFGNYYIYDALGPVIDLMREQLGFSYRQIGMLSTAYNVAALLVLLAGGYIIDRFGTKQAIIRVRPDLPVRRGADRGDAALRGDPGGPLPARARRRAADRRRDDRAGEVVQGQGAELRLRHQPVRLAARFRLGGLVDLVRQPAVLQLAGSAVAGDRRGRHLGDGRRSSTGCWSAAPRAGSTSAPTAGTRASSSSRELYAFSRSYWYIVALCVVFYSTVFPFRTFAIDYFQQAHGLDRETAGLLSSMLPMAAIIATPLFGLWVDRVGRRSLFMAAGSLVMLPLFLMVTYLPPGPLVSLVPFVGGPQVPLTLLVVILLLGGVFSLIPAVMWPSVAYIVDGRRLGSAYALMTFCQQAGWAIVPIMIGFLNDLAPPGRRTRAATRRACGSIPRWPRSACSSPGSCGAPRPAPGVTAWRALPAEARPHGQLDERA